MENKNHNQSTILFEGRDIFGPWKCTLSIPDGWTVIRKGPTRPGDRCAILNTLQADNRSRPVEYGPTVIRGNWEPVKIENIGVPVGHFRAVIRNGGR